MKHYAYRALRILVAFIVAGAALVPAQMHAATNQPPVFTSAPPPTPITAGQSFSYLPVATDPDGDPISFTLSNTYAGMSIGADHTISWTPKYAGTFTAEVRAQDSFGNVTSQPIAITVVHGDMTSVKNNPIAASVIAGQTIAIQVTAFDQFNNQWDVSPLATLTAPSDALGSISGLTYVSEKSGSWQLTSHVGSFAATTSLTVAQGSIQGIASTPSQTSATTDQSVSVTTKAVDAKGNTWDVTGFTATTTSDPKGSTEKNIYHPHTAGTQRVTSTIHSLISSADITVTPGAPAFMSVEPTGPFTLALNATKQFSAVVTDRFGNLIDARQCTWNISGNLGTISSSGEFRATSSGSGFVQAAFAGLSAQVPVSIDKNLVATVRTSRTTPQVKGETVTQAEPSAEPKVDSDSPAKNTTPLCTVPALWVVIVILLAYEIILGAYFLLTRNEQDNTWWIFPVLLTIIALIIWNKYFCSQYAWWPWTLAGLGAATTVLLERRSKKPTPPPEQPKQPPMF